MAVYRTQLPIAEHCAAFVPVPGAADEGGFCERCHKHVHDVSAMTEPELRRFLAARVGTRVCLSYHTDAQGRVLLRPTPTPRLPPLVAVGALALLLAACAGHAVELELPGSVCRDADGYAVSCPEWSEPDMLNVPEVAGPIAACVPAGESGSDGCPVRPTAPALDHAPPTGVDPSVEPSGDGLAPDEPSLDEPSLDAGRGASGHVTRGALRVTKVQTLTIERGFVPTIELLQESRERRAERKVAHERWRASRRANASP